MSSHDLIFASLASERDARTRKLLASSSASLTPIQARNKTLGTRHATRCRLLGGATLYPCQSATVKLIFDEGLERYMQAVLIHACQHDIFYGMHSQCLITMNVCSQLVLVEATAGNAIKLSLS